MKHFVLSRKSHLVAQVTKNDQDHFTGSTHYLNLLCGVFKWGFSFVLLFLLTLTMPLTFLLAVSLCIFNLCLLLFCRLSSLLYSLSVLYPRLNRWIEFSRLLLRMHFCPCFSMLSLPLICIFSWPVLGSCCGPSE